MSDAGFDYLAFPAVSGVRKLCHMEPIYAGINLSPLLCVDLGIML